jgi:RND family efflux transporter MFP subunit
MGVVLLLSFLTTACSKPEEKNTARAVPVQWQTVKSGSIINSSEFVGTLQAKKRVQLAPQIEGRILTIFVDSGAVVQQGDPIILLEPIRQQEDVNAAVGNLNVQKAAFDKAEADLRTIEAQRDAAKAEVANREANVASARANLANAEQILQQRAAELQKEDANLRLAEINLGRSQQLFKEDVVPKQDLDNKTTERDTAKANRDAARKTVAAAKASRDDAKASVDAAIAALNQAKQNFKAAQERVSAAIADVDRQKASIFQAQGQLGSTNQTLIYNQVVAPISGVVGNIPVKVGDFVKVGQELTIITQNQIMELNINVPVGFSSQLKLGTPVDMINADGSTTIKGSISFISPVVNQQEQTILAKVRFDNNGSLRDQQFIRVRVIWDSQPGLLVPTSSVQTIGGEKFVYVAQEGQSPDGKPTKIARQKAVVLGNIQGQNYAVISGLSPNDQLITAGILNLRDGVPVVQNSPPK